MLVYRRFDSIWVGPTDQASPVECEQKYSVSLPGQGSKKVKKKKKVCFSTLFLSSLAGWRTLISSAHQSYKNEIRMEESFSSITDAGYLCNQAIHFYCLKPLKLFVLL